MLTRFLGGDEAVRYINYVDQSSLSAFERIITGDGGHAGADVLPIPSYTTARDTIRRGDALPNWFFPAATGFRAFFRLEFSQIALEFTS